jgi:hypothetical protein
MIITHKVSQKPLGRQHVAFHSRKLLSGNRGCPMICKSFGGIFMRLSVLLFAVACMVGVNGSDSYACTESASACVGGGIEVKPNFVVSVSYDEKPLTGVVVKIRAATGDDPKTWFAGVTDRVGHVRVSDLPTGEYWISTKLLGISAGEYCFQVRSKAKKPAAKLEFEWGAWAISTQIVAGNLTVYRPNPGVVGGQKFFRQTKKAGAGIPMRLTNIKTDETYQFVSGSDGSFAFPSLPDGTYVLHIGDSEFAEQHGIDESYDVIELSSQSERHFLAFAARPSDCPGLYFSIE